MACASPSTSFSNPPSLSLSKQLAGHTAVDRYVRSNMVIAIGTGSTTYYAIERIAELVKSGMLRNILCVCSSVDSERICREFGLECIDIDLLHRDNNMNNNNVNNNDINNNDNNITDNNINNDNMNTDHIKNDNNININNVHLCIDGADEVDINTLNLIKGRGGALLREKYLVQYAHQFVVVVDSSKLVASSIGEKRGKVKCEELVRRSDDSVNIMKQERSIGSTGGVPVCICKYGYLHTKDKIETSLNANGFTCTTSFRKVSTVTSGSNANSTRDDALYVTDDGFYIVDVYFSNNIDNAKKASDILLNVVGVVEHGFFLDLTQTVLVSNQAGTVVYRLQKHR